MASVGIPTVIYMNLFCGVFSERKKSAKSNKTRRLLGRILHKGFKVI